MSKNKELLINRVLGLVSGTISPDDFTPKHLTIAIGYGNENQYFINDKKVSKEKFDLQDSKQECSGFIVTYGGKHE